MNLPARPWRRIWLVHEELFGSADVAAMRSPRNPSDRERFYPINLMQDHNLHAAEDDLGRMIGRQSTVDIFFDRR